MYNNQRSLPTMLLPLAFPTDSLDYTTPASRTNFFQFFHPLDSYYPSSCRKLSTQPSFDRPSLKISLSAVENCLTRIIENEKPIRLNFYIIDFLELFFNSILIQNNILSLSFGDLTDHKKRKSFEGPGLLWLPSDIIHTNKLSHREERRFIHRPQQIVIIFNIGQRYRR
jgi:hypothetical protein